jgi:hypothetical protein
LNPTLDSLIDFLSVSLWRKISVAPALHFPKAKVSPRAAYQFICILASIAASTALGQSFEDSTSSFRYLKPIRMSLILPMEGASASLLNLARLASAEGG